jgi:hypothetical protein
MGAMTTKTPIFCVVALYLQRLPSFMTLKLELTIFNKRLIFNAGHIFGDLDIVLGIG